IRGIKYSSPIWFAIYSLTSYLSTIFVYIGLRSFILSHCNFSLYVLTLLKSIFLLIFALKHIFKYILSGNQLSNPLFPREGINIRGFLNIILNLFLILIISYL